MYYLTFFILSLIFLVTPFQVGLYYDSHFLLWEVVIGCLFLLNVAWFRFKNVEVILKSKLYLFVFVLPLMYIIVIPYAINPEGNWLTILRFFTYACFFIQLVWLKESPAIRNLFLIVFQLLGIGFILYGFLNLADLVNVGPCSPRRVCGPFLYPNTFASILGAYWFYTISLILYNKSNRGTNIILFLLTIGYGSLFILTYSRGGYILFAVISFIAIILYFKQLKKFLLYATSSLILSFFIFSFVSYDSEKELQVGPERLKTRITEISPTTPSAVARVDFYKEALNMSKESPWIGFGGESWWVYYPSHDDARFGLNQIHSGYLDFLIEIGWLGLFVFTLLFSFFLYQVFKSRSTLENEAHANGVILAIAFIVGHATIDFDLSYGTTWLLLFWFVAMGVIEGKQGHEVIKG